ncbi:hypothetical protein MICAH_10002 [Microcystis aeruginosa PCC 9809]|jgi:acyl carrier protein|uniref:Carrier domain-containing protein n=1 Tax=Microcystis aeruginosa PCC 9809 TaxID=1160285 RepID=I4HFW5_MICAE|nr:phosphopantetheine-binding protein [Microcystis aeruginosa]CCI20939.1 hypothetical protein MICAH_10002 [Microcystis aeruginosa PCC 9809]
MWRQIISSLLLPLDALPLTPNAKIDRRALPAPDHTQPELEETFIAPRTPLEQQLADIWMTLLKLEQVGVHDNFFELGGHSLLATQVASRLRQTFQVEIPLKELFELPTIAQLAQRIETILWATQKRQSSLGKLEKLIVETGIL